MKKKILKKKLGKIKKPKISKKMFGGLIFEPADDRNFSLGAIGLKPPVPLHNNDFRVYELEILDQKALDFCVSFSSRNHKQKQEKEKLSPTGFHNLVKNLIDGNKSWGTGIQSAMKCLTKYGCPEIKDFPYGAEKDRDFLLDNKHLTILQLSAAKHKSKSYFQVDLYPTKTFENFRAAMITYNECVVTGIMWNSAYDKTGADGILPMPTGRQVCGHAILCVGQKNINGKLYLDFVNSYGEGFGDKGHFYVSQEISDPYLYLGFISLDIDRSLAEVLMLYNGKAIKLDDENVVDVYWVANGEKHLLKNEFYAWSYGVKLWPTWGNIVPATKEDFNLIPTGQPAKIEEGQHWEIMKELATKFNINYEKDWL